MLAWTVIRLARLPFAVAAAVVMMAGLAVLFVLAPESSEDWYPTEMREFLWPPGPPPWLPR